MAGVPKGGRYVGSMSGDSQEAQLAQNPGAIREAQAHAGRLYGVGRRIDLVGDRAERSWSRDINPEAAADHHRLIEQP